MKKLGHFIRIGSSRVHDAAIILDGEDPREALAESVVQSISTDVEVTLGDVKIHLAAIMDPEHWEEDWRERGIENVDGFIAGLVTDDGRS